MKFTFKGICFHDWVPLQVSIGLAKRGVLLRRFCLKCNRHQINKVGERKWFDSGDPDRLYSNITRIEDMPESPNPETTHSLFETRESRALHMIDEMQLDAWLKKYKELERIKK